MALYYTCSYNHRGDTVDIQLHTGNVAGMEKMRNNAPDVLSVQADGDELEAIRNQFTNIPMHNGRVVEWTGENAKFIARHLR